ncbi:MAG TPA: flagellar motor protein MotB [Polyangiaceae bacterium]|jgi:chemotaxis protein MotB|nr:flagellar motor protein MotB [Polyangiaceae bacterium]
MSYDQDPYAPRSRTWPKVLLGAGVVLLLGVTWFSWKLWKVTDGDLTAARAKLTEVEATSSSTKKKLAAAEADRDKLMQTNSELGDAKTRLVAAESRLGELEAEHAEYGSRLAEFKEMSEKFKTLIDAGTLQITFRRGRAIVTLPAGVLFDSGSADLSAEGAKTVAEVTKILRGVGKRRFIVAGHTDNVPAVKEYKSNWSLSTARAVTVLEAMVHSGLSPANLSATGYAEFDPVASNGRPAGRQRNRRIELVLEPYLTPPPK